jgi:hypothetical protein
MDIGKEIISMKHRGYTLSDTYIYLKDYVSLEVCIEMWETV